MLQHFNASFFSFNLYKWVTLDYKNKLNVIAGPKRAKQCYKLLQFQFFATTQNLKIKVPWVRYKGLQAESKRYKDANSCYFVLQHFLPSLSSFILYKRVTLIKDQILGKLCYNISTYHFLVLISINELHWITRTN